ncbi:MAG TPA: hypothetical protein VIY10_19955 [Solirubrobacteraceae bacterium]
MSVTTPTLKSFGFVVPLADVAAALDDVAAGALDELEPPPAALELDELLLPHAASDRAATIPTVHIPR